MKQKLAIMLSIIMLVIGVAGNYAFASGNTTDTAFDFTLNPTSSEADYDTTAKRHKEKDNKVYVKVTSIDSNAISVAWIQGSKRSAPTTFMNCANNKNYNLSQKGVQYMSNNVIGNDCYYARIAIKGRAGTGDNRIKGVWSPDNSSNI